MASHRFSSPPPPPDCRLRALFITALAFTDAAVADEAKVGIFAGSLVAGVIGTLILATSKKTAEVAEDEPIDELVAA